MNNKGFSLIELIMVIAIIALLALIFTPNVMNLLNKNNTNAYNNAIDSIKSAAETYISNNRYESVVSSNIKCTSTDTSKSFEITLNTLIASGDLSKIPDNPCSNQTAFKGTDKVKVTFNCKTKAFTYSFGKEIKENEC